MISVIIPTCQEPYLQNTIDDLLRNARKKIEIIIILDGYWPDPIVKDNPCVKIIHFSERRGMRHCINAGANVAQGKYILKCDAHCAFDEGYDVKLKADCEPGWTVVPKAFQLDAKRWKIKERKRREFQYIRKYDLKGIDWHEFEARVEGQSICDLMTFQGSCWFMHKEWFEKIGGEDDINYGWTGREAQEISLKTWLSGGRCILNRNTWYAHWNKPKQHLVVSVPEKKKSVAYAYTYWMYKWKGPRDMNWLVDYFKPVPTWHDDKEKSPKILPGIGRKHLYKKFAKMGFTKGAEIGVWDGFNAKSMLKLIPGLHLYLVDPYKYYKSLPRLKDRYSKAKGRAHRNLGKSNVTWLEEMSARAANRVENGSLDFVYIDGNHMYEYALLDIMVWEKKVRRGGIVSGHDYYNHHKVQVKDAVDDFLRMKGYQLYLTDGKADPSRRRGKDGTPSWLWIQR